ncbi:hypothetical protein E2C01_093904 [Portunus trituberculatus]|uniref:Uncharacterized protein n=1 Tax=Portunus trituberculatus TaxID=210409 RepID=A0A5B7JKC7_PORTR|nr:hypothetical protein [Portunus trituberculatus]
MRSRININQSSALPSIGRPEKPLEKRLTKLPSSLVLRCAVWGPEKPTSPSHIYRLLFLARGGSVLCFLGNESGEKCRN